MLSSKSLSAFLLLIAVSSCAAQSEPGSQAKEFIRIHEVVFKDGVGCDSKKLIESVNRQVGIR